MYLTLFAAQKQGAADGASARELYANRLSMKPSPALAWGKARLAAQAANTDDLAWRVAYAVAWLQAAQAVKLRGWKLRLAHLEKVTKAANAALAWVDELAAPEMHAPVQTLETALKRWRRAEHQASAARARLLLAWQKLAAGEQELRKAS